jgi:hypothetical protein
MVFQLRAYDNGSCSQGIRPIFNVHLVSEGDSKDGTYEGIDKVCPKNPLLPYVFRICQEDVRRTNDLYIIHPILGEFRWCENTKYRGYANDVEQYYWYRSSKDGRGQYNFPIPKIIKEIKEQVERGEKFPPAVGCKYFTGVSRLLCAVNPSFDCGNCSNFEV